MYIYMFPETANICEENGVIVITILEAEILSFKDSYQGYPLLRKWPLKFWFLFCHFFFFFTFPLTLRTSVYQLTHEIKWNMTVQ